MMTLEEIIDEYEAKMLYREAKSDEIVVLCKKTHGEVRVELRGFENDLVDVMYELTRVKCSDVKRVYGDATIQSKGDESEEELWKGKFRDQFKKYKEKLRLSKIDKVVNAITITEHSDDKKFWQIAMERCLLDENDAELSYVYIGENSVWIGATPEILIKSRDKEGWYDSVALAGTMRADDDGEWSEKNILENDFVVDHFREINSEGEFASLKVGKRGERKACAVKHLKVDIVFEYYGDTDRLFKIVHPTPAVCGFPKEEARDIIRMTEDWRGFYGGYVRICNGEDEIRSYVNLRCMEIESEEGGSIVKYKVGVGLVSMSKEADEIQEVENKKESIKKQFGII